MITPMELSGTARLSPPVSPASVRVVRAGELEGHLEAWQQLSDCALFPNIAYEPWMALPVLQACSSTDQLYFLLVFGPEDKELWGFIPLEKQSRCLHLPIRNLAFWQHRYCYVTAPLLHASHAREALDAFWRWFETNGVGARVLDTNWLLADGEFHKLWIDFAIGRVSLMLNDFPRALYRSDKPLAEYLSHSVSRKSQLEFQRRERRLAELGALEYRTVNAPCQVDAWLEDFLKLEAAGWKGETGGRAFAAYEPDAEYFRTITREAFRRGRVMLLSLTLDGKPIAMRHTLLAGEGAFAFRTAYDETYAKYSPGTLLELEVMRRLRQNPGVRWMDSCAAPRHVLLNRIWRERRMIRRSLFSNGSIAGDLLLSILPLIRWAGKLVRPNNNPRYLQISTHSQGDLS
ncbi:MAG TPA: GNAT family N-acetyltransferase [Bryobacteraceae bacterium]|nr:GNAT family N-acetyltransferase [Bryobacteraceae bacterium]